MPKDTLTPKERWLAVVAGEKPDRVPMDMWATGEALGRLLAYLGCEYETLLERLHIDAPLMLEPEYVGPRLPPDTDVWGMRRRHVDYGTGVYDESATHPLAAYD